MKTPIKSLSLAMVVGLAPLSQAAVSFYVSDSAGKLGILDVTQPRETAFTSIGSLFDGTSTVRMSDLALSPSGVLYGVSFASSGNSSLYQINKGTALVTKIGTDVGASLNALTFRSDGTLFAAGPQKFMSIDLITGSGSTLGNLSGYESSGDLAFSPSQATLYLTIRSNANYLTTVDLGTGSATLVSGNSIGRDTVYGLDYGSNGKLYGFTASGQWVMQVDPVTGIGADLFNMNFLDTPVGPIDGATAIPVPEPATGMLMLFGSMMLAALRKSAR